MKGTKERHVKRLYQFLFGFLSYICNLMRRISLFQTYRTSFSQPFTGKVLFGAFFGCILAYLFKWSNRETFTMINVHPGHLELQGFSMSIEDPGAHDQNDEFHSMKDTSVADNLAKQVRVLCWIMTGPQNHDSRARSVKNTWGKRCNILLFMSSAEDDSLPTVKLPTREGREFLWQKTKEAFKYIHKHYLDKADWFLKADDDSYIVVENLRYMLLPYRADDPIYFGCHFNQIVKQGYMSGGAGYVLSREAVRRFVERAIGSWWACHQGHDGDEDVLIGFCLESVNVKPGDSRDSLGRHRFHPLPLSYFMYKKETLPDWYWNIIFHTHKQGMESHSDTAISFHYVAPEEMYALEFLIYHARPFGISYRIEKLQELVKARTLSSS